MNEKRGRKLNMDKEGLEITGTCVVPIIVYLTAEVRKVLSTINFNFTQCKHDGRGTVLMIHCLCQCYCDINETSF